MRRLFFRKFPETIQLREVRAAHISCIITPKIISVLRLYSSNLVRMAIQTVIYLPKGVSLQLKRMSKADIGCMVREIKRFQLLEYSLQDSPEQR